MSNNLFVAAILAATTFARTVLAGSSSSTDVKGTDQANENLRNNPFAVGDWSRRLFQAVARWLDFHV